MAAGKWDFTIEQGATFRRSLQWLDANQDPVPLAGMTARMHIRSKLPDATTLIELTTENGRITLNSPGGIVLFISATDTAALDFKTAVHDLEVVDPTAVPEDVVRLVEGKVTLSKEVTR